LEENSPPQKETLKRDRVSSSWFKCTKQYITLFTNWS